MITEKTRKDLEKAYEKMQNGILEAVPSAEDAVKEMKRMDKEFKKLSESVRKQIERGARRTTNLPV